MTGPFSIVGYDYWDERLCPDDMKARMSAYVLDPAMTTEQVLDLAADFAHLDRDRESSFETTPVGHIPVFPKPMRLSQVDDTAVCDTCHRHLLEIGVMNVNDREG